MACYRMPWRVVACGALASHAVTSRDIACCGMTCHDGMSWHVVGILRHATARQGMLWHGMGCYVAASRGIKCRSTSWHAEA